MKLNKLASAVSVSLAALVLTACGSSDDDQPIPTVIDNTAIQDAAKQAAEQAKIDILKKAALDEGLSEVDALKFANANKDKGLVVGSDEFKDAIAQFNDANKGEDTNGAQNAGDNNVMPDHRNPLLIGFDANTNTTVQSGHYVRNELSTFDRFANTNPENTGNAGTIANPTLNNQNPYLSNYMVGAEGTGANDIWAINYIGEFVEGPSGKEVNVEGLEVVTQYTTDSLDLNGKKALNEVELSVDPQDQETRGSIQRHNKAIVGKDVITFTDDKKTNVVANTAGKESGLYALGTAKDALGREKVKEEYISGAENEELKAGNGAGKAFFFGKNYKDWALNAKSVDTSEKRKAAQATIAANSYKADFDSKGVLAGNVEELKLTNVQYGRLTTNIDRLETDPRGDEKEMVLVPRQLKEKGTAGSVDIYFYRGTNETTTDQMKAIVAKNQEINYRGHALTYGISPFLDVKSAANVGLPNSFGVATKEGENNREAFGNFVQATLKTTGAKGELTGSIYNFVNKVASGDEKGSFTKQDLITFDGQLLGNTIVGGATNVATKEDGNFRASFFGENAEELGGNITSVVSGYSKATWGAVFGAERVEAKAEPTKDEPSTHYNFDLNTTGTGTNVKGP